jgi:hypothetical protein
MPGADGRAEHRRSRRKSEVTSLSILLDGGAEGIRTPDPHNAIVVLYQLSYDPIRSPNTLNSRVPLSKKMQSGNYFSGNSSAG